MTSFAVFKAECVQFFVAPQLYRSSAEAQRGFCGECGTTISWHGFAWDQDIIAIHTGLFEDAQTFVPAEHWFIGSALPWVTLDHDLPKYDGL